MLIGLTLQCLTAVYGGEAESGLGDGLYQGQSNDCRRGV